MFPIHYYPWELIDSKITAVDIVGIFIMYIGFFISIIIASIVAGLTGGSLFKSVGGWILTSITCMLLFVIILVIDDYNLGFFGSIILGEAIVTMIAKVGVNLLIFGALTAVIALIKGS